MRQSSLHPIARASLGAALLSLVAAPMAAAYAASPHTPSTTKNGADRATLADLPAFVDGVVAQQIATRQVAAAVVTVVANGKMLFTRGYGYADIGAEIPVDPESSLFHPGSVSKLFTWIALMQQVESGRVSLDADVNTYLDYRIPDFKGQPIRVRDLLAHAPGMSDVSGVITDDPRKVLPYQQWLKTNVPQRLWPAGTEVAYSNYGAALAGYIVERVSHEPYADYIERHIFGPLGMRSSTFREPLPPALAPRIVHEYRYADGMLVQKPIEYMGSVMPAGSATVSGPDMARFMLALLGDGALGRTRILSSKSIALLESDSIANAADLPGMAHGFLIYRKAGPRLVGHAGNTVNFHSDLVIAPSAGIGFFVSVTGGSGSSLARTELTSALIGRLFPQQPTPSWTGTEPPLPAGAYRANRRDYSRSADPAHDLTVAAAAPHRVMIKAEGVTTAWRQIGARTYEQVTGARAGGPYDRIQFYGTPDDPRMSFASQPYETYHLVKP